MHILFVTATRIGDAVLSTGLLSYLIDRHPTARLTIATGPVAAPLFEAVPQLERLEVIEKLRWSAHWLPFYAAVASRRWALVVDLRGSALAWLLWAGERRVMAKGDIREHRVRQLGRLFQLDPPPSPRLWTAPHHERAASALIPPGAPVLAIGPAANWRGKEWRAERFAALAQRLTAIYRQRYGTDAYGSGVGDADPRLVRSEPDRSIRPLGAARYVGAFSRFARRNVWSGLRSPDHGHADGRSLGRCR